MICELTKIVLSREGRTFYKDEPGSTPELILKNVPDSWFNNDVMVIEIALARDNKGIQPLPHVPRLSSSIDRRYNKTNSKTPNYVTVCRTKNRENVYKIAFSKNLPLSRNFKGETADIPSMFFHVKCGLHSQVTENFVIMSKRQPDVLNSIKRGRDTEQDSHGCKRQRRSDQMKALRTNHDLLVMEHNNMKKELQTLQMQNKSMSLLLRNLYEMAQIGLETPHTEPVLRCFHLTVNNINEMSWLKKKELKRL